MGFQFQNIKINNEIMPLGLDVKNPLISWQFTSDEPMLQSQLRIRVGTEKGGADAWDTDVQKRSRSIGLTYSGEPLKPQTRYYVTVDAWDQNGVSATGETEFETGLGDASMAAWNGAAWIGGSGENDYILLRREFTVDKKIEKARLYVAARGIYSVKINGSGVEDVYCATGLSQFAHHIMYQTYDVTEQIAGGTNAIGLMLAPGQWDDTYTYEQKNELCGEQPSVLLQMVLTYEDGTVETLLSDTEHWQCYEEEHLEGHGGEWYDAEQSWIYETCSTPGFSTDGINAAREITGLKEAEMISSRLASVTPCESYNAKSVFSSVDGSFVYDLERKITGIPKILLQGEAGTEVTIYYGASSKQLEKMELSDTVILGVEPVEYSPMFVIRTIQYIEIRGLEKAPELSEVQVVRMSGIKEVTGHFKCNNPRLNRLISDAEDQMRGAYIGVPTVYPSNKGEKFWIGDTPIFAKTASYLGDVRNHLFQNMRAKREMQTEDGRIPNVISLGDGVCDITCESMLIDMTWELYQQYGDMQLIRSNYEVMDTWMRTMEELGMPGMIDMGVLGDWQALEETDKYLMWNAFYVRNAALMKEFAAVLGQIEDIERYAEVENVAKVFWNHHFVEPKTGRTLNADGTLCDTQSSYVIGLDCRAFDDMYKYPATELLAQKCRELGHTVHTGLYGTNMLNKMLSRSGHNEDAYKLLTQTSYPSYLNQNQEDETKNIYNAFVLGDIAGWFFESVLGVKRDFGHPGYQKFILKPEITDFDEVSGGFEVPAGRIECSWKRIAGKVVYECTIPANTKATVKIGDVRKDLLSGTYRFEIEE